MTEDEPASQGPRAGKDQPASQNRPVNPFTVGVPVIGGEMFYGRDDVFEFIRRNLIGQYRDTHIALYGQSRTGKTSVLYQVHRDLDPAYRCVLIDLHGFDSLTGIGDLLSRIATSVSRGLRRDYALAIDAPDRSAFNADPQSVFESRFLDVVLTALGEDHLVLMLDEAIRLEEWFRAGRLDREVFDYFRHLMQHHPRLSFIFSLNSGLEEMEEHYASLFRPVLYHPISFLEEAAARKLITDPVRKFFEVSDEAVDAILRMTSGHPYYTQLVCHSLFDLWLRSPRPAMTAKDVDAVLDDAIIGGTASLTHVWLDSAPDEKAVMAAMATAMLDGQDAVTGREIRATWRQAGVPLPERTLSAALRRLDNRQVITGVQAYKFTVDLQRRWLDKHHRLDWVKNELADPLQQWTRDSRTRRTRHLAEAAILILVAFAAYVVSGILNGTTTSPPAISAGSVPSVSDTGPSPSPSAATARPIVDANKAAVQNGEQVIIEGRGFKPGETVYIDFWWGNVDDQYQIAKLIARADGGFGPIRAPIKVGLPGPSDAYSIKATGATSGRSASAPISIEASKLVGDGGVSPGGEDIPPGKPSAPAPTEQDHG